MLSSSMSDLKHWRLRTAGRLVRGAAHDIRNPVSVLTGNVQFAQECATADLRRLQQLEQACGPYATPMELQEAAAALIEGGRTDRDELVVALQECRVAMRQQLDAVEAMARIGREGEDDTPAPHALDAIVEEGVQSATLFGRHIAEVSVEVPRDKVTVRRSVLVLLVCVVVLDALERHGPGSQQHPLAIRLDGGELVFRHTAPPGPEPPALAPICEALGASYEHAPGEVRVRLSSA